MWLDLPVFQENPKIQTLKKQLLLFERLLTIVSPSNPYMDVLATPGPTASEGDLIWK